MKKISICLLTMSLTKKRKLYNLLYIPSIHETHGNSTNAIASLLLLSQISSVKISHSSPC